MRCDWVKWRNQCIGSCIGSIRTFSSKLSRTKCFLLVDIPKDFCWQILFQVWGNKTNCILRKWCIENIFSLFHFKIQEKKQYRIKYYILMFKLCKSTREEQLFLSVLSLKMCITPLTSQGNFKIQFLHVWLVNYLVHIFLGFFFCFCLLYLNILKAVDIQKD